MRAGSHGGVYRQRHHVTRQRRHTLGTHGIALICHCGTANLGCLERLLDFLHALQKPYIVCEFHCAFGNAGKHGQKFEIEFSRISLTADGKRFFKAHFIANEFVKFFHLFIIAGKKFLKTRLRAGRTFYAAKPEIIKDCRNVFVIFCEVLRPERRAFADGRRLRGLKMRERKRRKIFISVCKIFKFRDDSNDFIS